MLVSLEEAKLYLRECADDSDAEITSLIAAAEEFLKNAGAVLNPTSELAKLAVKILVAHWYENREPIGKADKLVYSLNSMIAQLKYCYPEVTV